MAVHALVVLPKGENPWAFSAQHETVLAVDFANKQRISASIAGHAAAFSAGADIRPPRQSPIMAIEAVTDREHRDSVRVATRRAVPALP
jgi:hypothetical protein